MKSGYVIFHIKEDEISKHISKRRIKYSRRILSYQYDETTPKIAANEQNKKGKECERYLRTSRFDHEQITTKQMAKDENHKVITRDRKYFRNGEHDFFASRASVMIVRHK